MDKNIVKLGGQAAIGLAVAYLVIGLTYFMVPAAQLKGFSPEFWPSLVEASFWRRLFQVAQAVGAALGVAVVLGVREHSEKRNEAWLGWASVLAYIGYALGIIDNVRSFQLERLQATMYVAGDAVVKASVNANAAIYNLDSMGVLGFGAVGLWVLISSRTLVAGGKIPAGLGWLGVATAALMGLVVIGFATLNTAFLTVAAGLGGFVVAPAYFLWLGLSMVGASAAKAKAPATRRKR